PQASCRYPGFGCGFKHTHVRVPGVVQDTEIAPRVGVVETTSDTQLCRSITIHVCHYGIFPDCARNTSLVAKDTTVRTTYDVQVALITVDDFRRAVPVKVEQRTSGVP